MSRTDPSKSPVRWPILLPVLLFLIGFSPILMVDDARAQMPEIRKRGHAVPKRGPLISELREDLDPEIAGPETIIRKYEDGAGNEVREYVINGAIFQIQVIPFNGPPYYLMDVNGDGLFEHRYRGYEPRIIVPQWVLFRF